ncbi:hypothetical protein [Streptomyces sp. HNM0574]|uniref:hypothetical protein n=1 Tax=Streptomyces sp. HNM0574 TaxID=2714954 RepID=UPI00146C2C7F|nr:hypothetical protein [Streptomyces sp. HNM0574]NLU69592.1 hypothetical protein [Streptomyces sp. HNM0574]
MGDRTKVETKELSAAADALVGIRSQLRRKDNDADDATRSSAARLNKAGGWRTPHGLTAFADRWNDQVKHLHDRLDGISDKLHESKVAYTQREQRESDNQDKIRQDFG